MEDERPEVDRAGAGRRGSAKDTRGNLSPDEGEFDSERAQVS